MDEIKTTTDLQRLIAECTAYDYKEALEEKKPKSWLKSVSAFSDGEGGSLFFGVDNDGTVVGLEDIQKTGEKISDGINDRMEKRGSGLKKICNATKAMKNYKEGRDPVFKSSPSQFMTIIYSMEYNGKDNDGRNDSVNDSRTDRLNDSVWNTYKTIKTNPGIQRKGISDITGKSIPTIDRHIALLAKSGLIEHRDSDKTGGYYAKK